MIINVLVLYGANMDIQVYRMTSVTLPFWVSSCFFPFLFNSLDFRYQLLLCGKI